MADTERTLHISINPDLIDKNVTGDATLYTTGFQNVAITPDEFTREILRVTAYCAQLDGARRTCHFRACNVASVDVDHGLTLAEALAHPACARTHCSSTQPARTRLKHTTSASCSGCQR